MLNKLLLGYDEDTILNTLENKSFDDILLLLNKSKLDGSVLPKSYIEKVLEIYSDNNKIIIIIKYGFDYNFGPQMEFPEKTLLIMAEARGVYFLHTMAYTYDPEHARYVAAKKIETFYDNARFLDYQILNKPMEDVTMDESNDWLDRMSMEYTMTRAK